jgi:signal transduction histidine kinase/CheY-like chemotaxis protein
MGIFLKLGAFQPLEQVAYQSLFQLRGLRSWDDRLVLVAIDDKSLEELGRFPWPRSYYAQLIDQLVDANPSVIAIDLIFSEPSPDDSFLAAAIAHQGRVVLAQAWTRDSIPLVPVSELQSQVIAIGHIQVNEDSDGLVRWIKPLIKGIPSFGVATLQVYSLVNTPIEFPSLTSDLWLNWPSSADAMPHYSFSDVLQGKVDPSVFQGKIVVIGATATGLDPTATPFDQNPPASGVHIQMAVIDNLLQGRFLHPLSRGWKVAILLLAGPLLSWLLTSQWMPRPVVLLCSICLGWGVLSLLLFHVNYLIPIAFPIALFLTTGGVVSITERLRENSLLQQQIESLWNLYQKDLVVRSPIRKPTMLPVGKRGQSLTLRRVMQLATLADQFGRSHSAQAAIARHLPIGLLAADLDGQVWFCNPIARELLQVQNGEFLPAYLVPDWLNLDHWKLLMTKLRMAMPLPITELKHHDRWFELRIEPLVYRVTQSTAPPNNQPLDGFLLLLEETTTRKRNEAELRRAKDAAEVASRSKGEFLANMSHELRTPLNAILGFTQLLHRDPSVNTQHQEYLNIIIRSGQHLLSLINDVLEMSKIEAGQAKLKLSSFDLYRLLQNLEEMLRLKAETKGLDLRFERSPTVPQFITTDEGKLRQILINLLGNAIKFTQQGSVTLSVSISKTSLSKNPTSIPTQENIQTNEPQELQFNICDTGPGIAPDEIQRLFQPFEQTRSGQQSEEGTGLGLAICRKFIELMQGSISVNSIVNEGSCFHVHLPIQLAVDQPVKEANTVIRTVTGLAPNQPPYRVLIAEDHWENSVFLEKLLTQIGFQIAVARNGQECIRLWKTLQPHLILMDMRMPIMDGYEATQNIKRTAKGQATVIIAVTGSAFEEDRSNILSIGCDDFIHKPFDSELLLNKIAKHLGVTYTYDVNESKEAIADPPIAPVQKLSNDIQQALQQQSQDWLDKLQYAASGCSESQVLELVEAIANQYPDLAKALTEMVYNFDYEGIVMVLDSLNQI